MKNILLKFIIKNVPIFFLSLGMNIMYKFSTRRTYIILKMIPLDKLSLLNCKFIKMKHILSDDEAAKFKYHVIDEEAYEAVRTPDVFKISKNNYVNLRRSEIALYLFENVNFRPKSDLLILDDAVFWEKSNKSEFAQMIPLDSDFINIDFPKKNLSYFLEKKVEHFDIGFNLCGVHTNAWAHFIISYIPKLMAISYIQDHEDCVLIIPSNIDLHNKGMVELFLQSYFKNRKFDIKYVDDDTIVHCSKLYYCNTINLFADHALLVHPSSTCISKYGSEIIANFRNNLFDKLTTSMPRKIYIGRGAGRNLTNALEVEHFFTSKGFEIVYPHLLSLSEKIDMFGNATHICGPVSSGFANFIFSKYNVKVLGFSNYARCFEPFISGLNHAGNLGHEILFLTGYEDINSSPNTSYYIDMQKIISACEEISFLD